MTISGATEAFSLQNGSPSSSTAAEKWWNSQYAYRQSVTVTNPAPSPLGNYPVFLPVAFPFSHLSDATAQLHLVNQNGAEVPSYVLDEVSSNGFVASAWLLALVNLAASSSGAFELYYGSTAATTPSYRTDSAAAKAQAGRLSLDVSGSEPASSSFQVTLGGTYSEQILSKVSYGTGTVQSFGASKISQSPALVVSPLSLVANVSASELALSSVYSAGALRYTQAYLLDNGTLVVAVLLTNMGKTAVPGVALTDLVDATNLAALGPLSTSYSPKSGLLSTGVSGAYFGYDSNLTASSFEVGNTARVVSDASNGDLSNASSGAGTATALSWNLGSIAAGGSTQLVSAWGVGGTLGGLAGSLAAYADQPQTIIGQEETYTATPSQMTSSWNVAIPIANTSVSGGGLTIPLSLIGAVPVASSIRLSGTASYLLPTGYASLSSQKGWIPESSSTGNVSAYATTAFYSIQQQSFADSVRVTVANGTGSGAAQLVSPVMSFPSSVSKSLTLRYRALFSGSGDLSNQWLYVAVDAGQAPTGPFTQALAVPASGSSTSISASGCESLYSPVVASSPPNPTVSSSGALVADGSWRSLNISLDGTFGTSSIYARLRFCAATTSGYTGQVELDVTSAGVEAKGNAPSFLSASVSETGSSVTLSYIPGAAFEPSSLTLNGMVSFPAVRSAPLTWNGSTSYRGTIQALLSLATSDPPGNDAQNRTSTGNSTAAATDLANATLVGVTISSQLYPLTPQIFVNGSAVAAEAVGNSLFVNSSDIVGKGASAFRFVDLALFFPGHDLGIRVVDANGNPLPRARITVSANGSAPVNESVTDSAGSLSLLLLPSNYDIAVDFQGVNVGTATAIVSSDGNVTVRTTVYPIPLQVKDAIGQPVGGADISVTSGASNIALTSDSAGMASFLGVPNKDYNVSVSIAGSTYYVGTLQGSPNRATFEFGTSYLPPSIQITIVGAIAASMIVASLVVYFGRMRPRGRTARRTQEPEL